MLDDRNILTRSHQSYGQIFESHDFSDSEASVASSDAESVDFGMGQVPIKNSAMAVNGFASGLEGGVTEGPYEIVKGATQEVTTNDYGTQFMPGPGQPGPGAQEVKSAVPSLKLNHTNPGEVLTRPQVGTPTGGGKTGPKARANAAGSPDMLATFRYVQPTPIEPGRAISSTTEQLTTAPARTYIGQLDTANAAKNPSGMPSTQTLLMLGGGLLVVGLLLKG